MFKIEKNVPIPERIYRDRQNYPFKQMDIGDSFCVPKEYEKSIRALASRWGKVLGRKFVVSKEDDKVRIWRVR